MQFFFSLSYKKEFWLNATHNVFIPVRQDHSSFPIYFLSFNIFFFLLPCLLAWLTWPCFFISSIKKKLVLSQVNQVMSMYVLYILRVALLIFVRCAMLLKTTYILFRICKQQNSFTTFCSEVIQWTTIPRYNVVKKIVLTWNTQSAKKCYLNFCEYFTRE